MGEFGERLAVCKAALDLPDPPRNSGRNRTDSKRALLDAMAASGAK
jgi:hypothetical protein